MPDWQALHDEYIAGGISQRKLAAKYGIDYGRIRDKSIRDGWVKDRERAMSKAQAKVEQKIATTAADNATTAARIKAKLLRKLEREIDYLPDKIGTDSSVTEQSGRAWASSSRAASSGVRRDSGTESGKRFSQAFMVQILLSARFRRHDEGRSSGRRWFFRRRNHYKAKET